MPSRNPFVEEGRTRLRNFGRRFWSYLFVFFALGALSGVFFFVRWTRGEMGALARMYFKQYVKAAVKSQALPGRTGKYTLLVSQAGGREIGVNDSLVYAVRDAQGRAVRDQYGWVFRAYPGAKIGELRWRQLRTRDNEIEGWLRQNVYDGESLPGLFAPALALWLIVTVAGTAAALAVDWRLNRKYEEGKLVRGTRLVEPGEYEREVKGADGLALRVRNMKAEGVLAGLMRKAMRRPEPSWTLRMRREEEAQGMLVLGDPGTGKSQFIQDILGQLASRDEAVVVYDPACEFVKSHYDPGRGDVIVNPLDMRGPFWSPSFELRYRTDYANLAEIFFPGDKSEMIQKDAFFLGASRDIFARMLERKPTPRQLIEWLSDKRIIDEMTAGTELAHYLDRQAGPQRGGVLASLGRVGKTLRLLPRAEECESEFSFTEWATQRRGWLFLTSTKDTEEQLRPLYAAFLDLLMRRLMSVDESWGRKHPCKLIVDEVHTLQYLPTLYKAITEGRKFGLHLVQGTQNKNQYDDFYGKAAPTMLSCPRYTIILRCKEPGSAQWLSMLIGNEEREKPRTGVTASVSDMGRDSINYSTQTEVRPVVSREEIAGLDDLAGYWKYGNMVVPFRFDFRPPRRVAVGYAPRRSLEELEQIVDDDPDMEGAEAEEEMSCETPEYKREAPAAAQAATIDHDGDSIYAFDQ